MGKQKTYSPSVWGLLKYGYDALTGLTEYPELEAVIQDLGGSPDTSNKTATERNKDYFHPIWGAAERWKASMSNDTNPMVGIGRTIVPAVVFGTAAAATPQLISGASRAIPHVYKAAVAHPKLVSKIAGKQAFNFGKALTKGILGGEAVNLGTDTFTGKDWGELVSPYLGVSKDVADWTNPGYLLGGKNWGITDAIKSYRANKKIAPKLAEQEKALREQLTTITNLRQLLLDRLRTLVNLRYGLGELYNREIFSATDAKYKVENARPIEQVVINERKRAIKENNKIFRGELNPEGKIASVELNYTPIGTTSEKIGVEELVNFTSPSGETSTVPVKILSKPTSSINLEGLLIPYKITNGTLTPEYTKLILSLEGRFGSIIEGDTKGLQKSIGKYVDLLENVMGEDGTVAGSLIHYKNGILKGTQTDNGLIGPADTEIYTTRARLPQLLEKLKFSLSRNNSTGGLKGTSPHTFRNNDSLHQGVDTEINIIEADADGKATGKIAHQIYRALWPELYSKLLYDATMSGKLTAASEISLPISAENLLLHLKQNPQAMLQHLLVDMVGMETFTRPQNIKASKRLFSVLFNADDLVPKLLHNALVAHGKYNLGSLFKLGSELYPNLKFDNVEANKEFLKSVFNLSEEELNKVASNPDIVRNAFDLYNFQYSTGTRLLGNDVLSEVAENGLLLHNPKIEMFTGNASFSGGTGSGPGLNTALLNPFGGWAPGQSVRNVTRNTLAISLRPLTFHPEKIQTPADLVKQIKHLLDVPGKEYYEGELAGNVRDKTVPFKYNTERMKEISELAERDDLPVFLNMNNYGFGYSGGLSDPISAGARHVTSEDHPELGSLLKDIAEYKGRKSYTYPVEDVPKKALDFLETIRASGDKGIKKFMEQYSKMTPEEKILLIKGKRVRISEDNLPEMLLDLIYTSPRDMRRRTWSYNSSETVPVTLNGETKEVTAQNILEAIRNAQVGRFYLNLLKLQNLPVSSEAATDEEYAKLLKNATSLWSQYTKYYKLLRRKAYEAKVKLAKTKKKLKQLDNEVHLIRHEQDPSLYEKERDLKHKISGISTSKYAAEWALRKAKEDLKTKGIVGTGLTSLAFLINKAVNSNRQFDIESRKHANLEFIGKENPDNGYYEYALMLEGKSQLEINELIKKAKKRYIERQALKKSKKLKGGKLCLIPRN